MKNGITLDLSTKRQNFFTLPDYLKDELLEISEILKSKKKYFLLFGKYDEFPNSISGNDLDVLIDDTSETLLILKKYGWITKSEFSGEFRAFKLLPDSRLFVLDFLSADREKCPIKSEIYNNAFQEYTDGEYISRSQIACVSLKHIIKYKAFSYIQLGFVHSKYQLKNLKQDFQGLNLMEQNEVLDLFDKFSYPEIYQFLVDEAFNWLEIKGKVEAKREHRLAKRLVFAGNFYLKNIIKNFVTDRLLMVKGNMRPNPLPVIAIVGNDGCGKTTMCELYLKEEFKIDPIHINMRANASWSNIWLKYRPHLVRLIRRFRKIFLLRWLANLLAFIFELTDFCDKYIRYRVGMTLGNSGVGVVLFERYPTDRLRGEYYPNLSLYPLEKFFPMPDAFIYLDVLPETSLSRKPDDGHTHKEMYQKRENYIKLLSEISNVKMINAEMPASEVTREFKKHIYDIVLEKQNSKNYKSAKWVPNKSARRKAVQDKTIKQKDGFM